jgi:hypothetical protein
MDALPPPLNAGRPWAPEDTEALRRLAGEDVAPDLIAARLGRSLGALADRAERIGVGLRKGPAAGFAVRREARPPVSGTRTSTPRAGGAIGGPPPPEAYVRVRRAARPPLPWTREIRRDGHEGSLRRAVRGYRSAEDAREAGRAALAGLGHAGRR